jgi:hypothetical protein
MAEKQKRNDKTELVSEYKVFDSSFAIMVEESPVLLIPLVNEAFATNYGKGDAIVLRRDSHHTKNGVIVTDVLVEIGGRQYHIECQSFEDGTMQIRMLEYDFAIAVEQARQGKNYMELNFPKSCVLQLRSNDNTPDKLEVKLNFQDGRSAVYTAPVIKVDDYTYDEMLEKDLLMLIPFYSMRYEKAIKDNKEDELSKLYEDMAVIINSLQSVGNAEQELSLRQMIVEMFVKICYYMGRNNSKCEGRMDKVMVENTLQLETIRFKREGRAEGRAEGRFEGIAEGKKEDILELLEECGEVTETVKKAVNNQNDITILRKWIKIAAKVSSIEEFEKETNIIK